MRGMKMTELFLGELEREAKVTRRTLEEVPDGVAPGWRPHPKSMEFGYLANLVAALPTWIVMTIDQDQLDLNPPGGKGYQQPAFTTAAELVAAFDRNIADARRSLERTTDEHLLTNWQLLFGGQVVQENPRHIVLRDSVFNHIVHHRGQLTVYLRLNEAKVPSIYGPSADVRSF
jgi:uncharacterized damage-inducible protein DinB